MKTLIPTLIIGLIVLGSCTKEQRIVNRMEGKWTVTKAEIMNAGTFEPNMVFQFDHCNMRTTDFCDYSLHDFDQDIIINGTYAIGQNGQSVLLSSLNGWGINFEEFEIEKLGINRMRLVNNDAQAGEFRQFNLRCID
jgi:hypothetical protein